MHATQVDGTREKQAASNDAATLPAGDLVGLPGRGEVFVRQLPGPPGAPVVVLLHGWTATADLNWQTSYQALGRHFRVIAFDHRGHGRGLRAPAGFRLEDCADDVAAVAAQLGVDRCIPVGYSMGGPIASLVWRRHLELVEGLVLCATSRHFAATPARRAFFSVLNGTSAVASTTPLRAIGRWSGSAWTRRLEHRDRPSWMVEQVLAHDWTQVVDAGRAIGRFDSRRWAGNIDVPTAVLVSLDDDVVPTCQQLELARAVPGASVHMVPGGHTACMDRSSHFVSSVLDACRSVANRANARLDRDWILGDGPRTPTRSLASRAA